MATIHVKRAYKYRSCPTATQAGLPRVERNADGHPVPLGRTARSRNTYPEYTVTYAGDDRHVSGTAAVMVEFVG